MLTFEQLSFTLVPPLLLLGSGAVAAFHPPKAWLRGGILHLAAGVVFAVVAVELIPDLLRDHRPVETVIGFAMQADGSLSGIGTVGGLPVGSVGIAAW